MPERYGHAFTRSVKMVGLWWYSASFRNAKDLAERPTDEFAGRALNGPGVYAFEGKHDSRPEGGLLYIGRVGKTGAEDSDADTDTSSRALRSRILESGSRFIWRDANGSGLYADVWDLTIRFATVDPSIIVPLETLLIKAHAPSFNAQQVRGRLSDENAQNLVVMNDGDKGRMLPVLVGAYYQRDLWDGMEGG